MNGLGSMFSRILVAGCILWAVGTARGESPAPASRPDLLWMWIQAGETVPDTYGAFRGWFELDRDAEIELRTIGSSWYGIWLDGHYVDEGPARFPADHPEYQTRPLKLSAGRHLLAVQVHHIGETTRLLVDMPPFLYCQVVADGQPMPIDWRCSRLAGYKARCLSAWSICTAWCWTKTARKCRRPSPRPASIRST